MNKYNQKQAKQLKKPEQVRTTSTKWMSVFIFLSGFFLYSNTFKHDFALDDDIYTKKNVFIQKGFSSLPDIFNKGSLVGFNGSNDSNYRPFTLFNFLIETEIWGINPHVNHFFNVILYSLSCLLLFLFLKQLFKSPSPYILPFLVTVLFTYHPIHTEVVANIKSRDEILSLLFGLLTFRAVINYIDFGKRSQLYLSFFLFFIATLCKENSLTFVIVIPLIIFFFRDLPIKKVATLTIPFILIAGIYIVIRLNILDDVTFKEDMAVMNNSLMAAKNASEMYATNFVMLGKYLMLLLIPHPLSWDYSYNQIPIVNWLNFKALLSFLIYAGLGVYALIKLPKKDIFSFAILFYFITIFLSSNLIVKIGATMGERFLYAPSIGFCIAIPVALLKIFKIEKGTFSFTSRWTNLLIIILFISLLYSIKTRRRNPDWKNNYQLFLSGVETSPNSARTHYSLASELRTKGEQSSDMRERLNFYTQAIQEYRSGISIYPGAEGYYNLGVTYYNMNDTAQAMEAYQKALSYQQDYAPALNNTGVIYFINNQYDKAEVYFKNVLKHDSSYADAYANLGAINHNRGDYDVALKLYNEALKRNPNNINVYNNMVRIYNNIGDTAKAKYYQQKIQALQQ